MIYLLVYLLLKKTEMLVQNNVIKKTSDVEVVILDKSNKISKR